MSIKQTFAALLSSLLLFSFPTLTAFAEVALPEGAVKGLPERLAALDDAGNPVNSETGEYFFHVEDMQYGVTYTKKVQLMNLRDDASYYIYFYTEPLYKDGTIDLEKGCECRFYLDDELFYTGDVNGHGNIDLTEHYQNCGYYAPGDSHVLRAEVIWNDLDVLQNVDNGHRLVDKDGEHVLVGPDESGHVEGEIEFKWIFFASILPIDDSSATETTTAPNTDVKDNTETETTVVTDDNMTDIQTTTGYFDDSSMTDTNVSSDNTDSSDDTDNTDDTDDSTISTTTTTTTTTTPSGGLFTSPYTGYIAKDGTVWLVGMGVISVMIVILLVLIHKKKKDQKK